MSFRWKTSLRWFGAAALFWAALALSWCAVYSLPPNPNT